MRGATLFSGGGGVECLLKDRIDFVRAVEYDPAIAAVYRQNHGDHVQVADVCDVDYSLWGQLDYLHASPVCKNASQAKTDGEESDTDIQTALAVVRCLEQTEPRVFTLENVGGYQKFKAYRLICRALDLAGYMWHAEVLNAADFGVPQTRRRLILRAVRDSLLPGWPAPLPWVGWYAAIEDLIPTLPESKFADWQLARLPEELSDTMLLDLGNTSRDATQLAAAQPAMTVQAWHGRRPSHAPQAFIVSNAATMDIRDAPDPMVTIVANRGRGAMPRAWLTQLQSGARGDWRRDDEPAKTICAGDPAHQRLAWLQSGRVVKMTPRALARFQSIPDSFWLPEKAALACTVIGNAVPSLLMREVVRPLL